MNYIKNLSPLYIVSHYLQVGKNKKNIPSDYSAIAPLIFFLTVLNRKYNKSDYHVNMCKS